MDIANMTETHTVIASSQPLKTDSAVTAVSSHEVPNNRSDKNIKNVLDDPYSSPLLEGEDPYEDGNYSAVLPSQMHDRKRGSGINHIPDRDDEFKGWDFKPLKTLTPHQSRNVERWQHHVHPDGHYYYYLAQGELRYFSYLTKHDVSDSRVLKELEWFIAWLEQTARELPGTEKARLPTDVEVVLNTDLDRENDEMANWTYYMADIESQGIFFLHDAEFSKEMSPSISCRNQESSHHFFTTQYWVHVRDFPKHRNLRREREQVLGILSSYLLDNTLEPRNDQEALFDTQDMQVSLGVIKDLHNVQEDFDRPSGHLLYCIATVMVVLEREQFRKLCGDARKAKQTWLANFMLLLLLNQPSSILEHMKKMFKDNLVSKQEWTTLHEKLEKESSVFAIYATVLLAVDISFLAVPSVVGATDQNTLSADQNTLTTLTGQLSMITCLGSIVIGLLQGRQERIDTKDRANSYDSKVFRYLKGNSNNVPYSGLRLEVIAIQYSLPFGLLQWGIVFFVVSVMASFFDPKFTIVGFTARRWIYGAVCVVVAILVLWTIIIGLMINSSQPPGEGDQKGPVVKPPWYKPLVSWYPWSKPSQNSSGLPLHHQTTSQTPILKA